MSRTLKFYGASDDLFEIEGTCGDEPDEVICHETPVVAMVKGGDEGLCVVAMYAPGDAAACWSIGIMPLDEYGVPIPSWPMTWRLSEECYSPELTLTVPDDAVVSMIGEGEAEEEYGGRRALAGTPEAEPVLDWCI